jgi:hypothetical protein
MVLFGTISPPALEQTVTPITQRAFHRRLISATPRLLLNAAPSYRGFRILRLAAQ